MVVVGLREREREQRKRAEQKKRLHERWCRERRKQKNWWGWGEGYYWGYSSLVGYRGGWGVLLLERKRERKFRGYVVIMAVAREGIVSTAPFIQALCPQPPHPPATIRTTSAIHYVFSVCTAGSFQSANLYITLEAHRSSWKHNFLFGSHFLLYPLSKHFY